MKKLLAMFGLLLGITALSYAGTPRETFYSGQAMFSNASIVGSTASVSSAVNISTTFAATSVNGVSCRACLTNFAVQMPTTTVLTILDGATTSYTYYGVGVASSGVNTLQINRDHLGPICFTAGNSMRFNLINTAGAAVPQAVNFDGYTDCGGTNNAGL